MRMTSSPSSRRFGAALFCAAALILWLGAVHPARSSSRYTKVNDPSACALKEEQGGADGPGSCEYLCEGPIAGVKTRLLSCGDWDHLHFQIDGSWRSTWSAMTAVGRMSGIGNKNGVVEWVFDGDRLAERQQLQGLIVRFNGTTGDNKSVQALSVFGLRKGEICWKGNFNTNEAARTAVQEALCVERLEAEK